MNKSFTLLSLLAFTEAVKLDCGPCCGGGDRDEDGDADGDDQPLNIIETVIDPIDPSKQTSNPDTETTDPGLEITEPGLDGEPTSAVIYENEDCTGESLHLDLFLNGETHVEYDTAALYDMGWDDRGASLFVPSGTQVKLFQHPDMTGESEAF